MNSNFAKRISSCVLLCALGSAVSAGAAEPLPSWNALNNKTRIVDFIERVTTEGGGDFVPVDERIAVFDNDGTLWSEKPIYFQMAFAIDRVKALAPDHPEWKTQQPFQAALENDLDGLFRSGRTGLSKLILATHTGMTVAGFEQTVKDWVATARHPRFERPYTELVFQPMLELLSYLRANKFKTFIVSGGGIGFMRPWTKRVYGIGPEQVVGTSFKYQFEHRNNRLVIARLPQIDFINDKAGKPVGIRKFIGRRPIAAFGNSDGDLQMLQWTAAGKGARLMALVHHTDAKREWAYDRMSHVGRLDAALDEAKSRGWTIIDMKRDWKVIYPVPPNRPEE